MKHLAFALLTLIVLGGCATGGLYRGYVLDSSDDDLLTLLYEDSSINVVNETFEIPDNFIFIKFNLLNSEDSFLEAYVSPRTFEMQRDYLGGIYGVWIVSALRISKACNKYSGDRCLLDEFKGKNYLQESLAATCSSEKIEGLWRYPSEQEKISKSPRCIPLLQKEEELKKLVLKQKEQDAFNKLYSTCLSYGFEERSTIASCIQQEIFNEKKLALLKQQQSAQMAYVNQQQIKEQEENNFWLLLLEGVAENLADPNTWENARQNAEIQKLKRQQIFRN